MNPNDFPVNSGGRKSKSKGRGRTQRRGRGRGRTQRGGNRLLYSPTTL